MIDYGYLYLCLVVIAIIVGGTALLVLDSQFNQLETAETQPIEEVCR